MKYSEADKIQAALQEIGVEEMPDALLCQWVLVAEWVSPEDGRRWLTRMYSPELPTWGAQGMLFNALHTDWHEVTG